MTCVKYYTNNMPISKYRSIVNVAIFIVAIACTIGTVDYFRFERACRNMRELSSKLDGHPGSIGGWPIGREYAIRFDHPLSDDALRRLVTAASESRRIYISLHFSCVVSDTRLAAMRKMVAPYGIRLETPSQEKMLKQN